MGSGYAASLLRHLPWLADIDLWYWGDIDTHGFAILSRVRGHFPHTRSLLMDRHTSSPTEHTGAKRNTRPANHRHISPRQKPNWNKICAWAPTSRICAWSKNASPSAQ
ncbi:hypothetical protein SHKM778_95390 (plasmid) [Streptomyces sp. KM77-8]|uniref:Wadjet protein JetD C-terminal domain-containing protein n=1 Tax=Streptomyces haneummycinicus TaxID=3074435 RepID=A0AAT9I0A5_9ACTN